MAKMLFEASGFTIDLRSIYNPSRTEPEETNQNNEQTNVENSSNNNTEPDLAKVLERNGITDQNIIKKLVSFGDPLKKAIKILGENIDANGNEVKRNPILAFIQQAKVQTNLIASDLVNASTFKAIYNAVAKNLVADSEFLTENSYNILYCKALYKRSTKEIEQYLTLQSRILSPSAKSYSGELQLKNRKIFLENTGGETPPTVQTAEKLNNLTLAMKLAGVSTNENTKVHRNSEELDKIVSKLTDIQSKFAAILSLSTSTKSTEAKRALSDSIFNNVSKEQTIEAFVKLSTSNVLPKGELQTDDADALVQKILNAAKNTR